MGTVRPSWRTLCELTKIGDLEEWREAGEARNLERSTVRSAPQNGATRPLSVRGVGESNRLGAQEWACSAASLYLARNLLGTERGRRKRLRDLFEMSNSPAPPAGLFL